MPALKKQLPRKPALNVVELPSFSMAYKRVNRDPELIETIDAMLNSGMSIAGISNRCGVSESCLRNWLAGKTRRPQNITISFVLRACGFKRVIMRIKP